MNIFKYMNNINGTKTLFGIIFIFRIVTLWLLEKKLIKRILKYYAYTDIHDHALMRGNSTRQWNIASVIIVSELLTHCILNYVQIINCEEVMNYDNDKGFTTITLFLSYIAYDLMFHKLTIEFYIHHILGFLTVLYVFLTNYKYGIYVTMLCILTEVSTIPLTMIYLTSGKIRITFTIIFSIIFFIARPCYLLYVLSLIHLCFVYEFTYLFSYMVVLIIYILNIFWFLKIIRKIFNNMCVKEKKQD